MHIASVLETGPEQVLSCPLCFEAIGFSEDDSKVELLANWPHLLQGNSGMVTMPSNEGNILLHLAPCRDCGGENGSGMTLILGGK